MRGIKIFSIRIHTLLIFWTIQATTQNQDMKTVDERFTDYTAIRAGKNSRTSTREETIEWGKKVLKELNIDHMSGTQKAAAIQNYVHRHFGFSSRQYGKLARFIEAGTGNCNSHARMGIFLLRLAGVPAKFAWESHLIPTSERRARKVQKSGRWISGYYTGGHVWVLFFDGESWLPFDSSFGYTGWDAFVKYRWEGVEYATTQPPYVIWEDTGYGFDDMTNITQSVWSRFRLKNHNRVSHQDWMEFISLFTNKNVESTRESLSKHEKKEIERIARNYFVHKKISRIEISPSIIKYLDSQKRLQRDKENYYLASFEIRCLAYHLLEDGKTNDAIELFTLYTRLFPKYAWAYGLLGEAYAVHGDKAMAIESYRKAIELDPNRYFILELKALEER